jgi:hypothetical protein
VKIWKWKKDKILERSVAGDFSLTIQFWEIYMIVNERSISLRDAWDGFNLRFTFTMTIDSRLMNTWLELKQIVSLVDLVEEDDNIIWQYNFSGRFSVQSLYAVVNDRGVKPVYTPVMWNISVPSRVHIFI